MIEDKVKPSESISIEVIRDGKVYRKLQTQKPLVIPSANPVKPSK